MATLYLIHGYTRDVIKQNFVTLRMMGETKGTAINKAHAAARASYWQARPGTQLPAWIYPREIAQHSRHKSSTAIKRNPSARGAPRNNPISADAIAEAANLSERFAGRAPDRSEKMPKPRIPDALACIGQVSVIQYIAERDGEVNEYRHVFKSKSRPHLCVSPDGKTVLMLGGAFTFKVDGFTDE